jgi:transcriptional regulator with PAS, ATPase and Fis domain
VTTPIPEAVREGLRVLLPLASLAMEVSALRGYSAPRAELEVEEEFVALSTSMRRLRDEVLRLGGSRATVLLSGESGAGKEVIARAIHRHSRRADKPLIAFNCAAVPRELFEGQLFGFRRGAFTGAQADSPGVLRAGEGGTVFLDEVGELPLDVQPKLLRFLENGEVFPIGERRPTRVDVRIIAATNRELAHEVTAGRFREDLYYRLNVVPLRVPPLRARTEDIPALARLFLRQLTPAGQPTPVLGADAVAALQSRPWPGNVRELRNVIERLMAFAPVPVVIGAGDLG